MWKLREHRDSEEGSIHATGRCWIPSRVVTQQWVVVEITVGFAGVELSVACVVGIAGELSSDAIDDATLGVSGTGNGFHLNCFTRDGHCVFKSAVSGARGLQVSFIRKDESSGIGYWGHILQEVITGSIVERLNV